MSLHSFYPCVSLATLLLVVLSLQGCSGGGGDNGTSAANIASVNAGRDISVQEGQNFTLNAAVFPAEGSIQWQQVSGPNVDMSTVAQALSIDLPTPIINVDSILVFQATYTAPDGQVVTDLISVNVENVNASPVAIIELQEQTLPPFNTYEIVTLSGENSTDADGEVRSFEWRQVDDNPALKFTSNTSSSVLEFEAPLVNEITNYKLQLTVTDNFNATGSNVIDVQIAASSSVLAANAGDDQSVDEFQRVNLDASQSVSVISEVDCQWQQLSGIPAAITDPASCVTEFVAPDVDSTTTLIMQLTVADSDNNQATDTVNITVMPLNLGNLHDTGVTECYDNSLVINCGTDDFPAQDAESGRDSVRSLLDKSGSGDKAFDFTKFDANGDEISNDALVFSCVRDNFTGLIWEVKEPTPVPEFSALRGVENYYSKNEGLAASATCASTSACDVDTYIEEVNTATFCGGANWRLPTYMELLAIMDYGDLDDASLLDAEFFPYSPDAARLNHKFYWVSDTSAEGGAANFNWVLDMQTGDDAAILFTTGAYVRLVRTP